jgi:MFS family permease
MIMNTNETVTGESRRARVAVLMFFLVCGLVFASWAVRIPAIKDRFHFNEAELGGVLFMLPLGSFLGLPFAGWAVHRFGSRLITTLSALGYAAILFLLALADTPIQLSIALFAFGFFGDTLNIAMNTQGIAVQAQYTRPLMSSFHAFWSVGALIGAVTGGLATRFHLSTLQHLAGVSVACVLVVALIKGRQLTDHDLRGNDQPLLAWPDKALMVLGLICFCCSLSEGAMADWSSLYYRQVLEDPVQGGTTGYTAFIFAMAVGRFTGDVLIQRFRYRKMLMADGLLMAAGLGIALAIPHPWVILLGYAAVGFGVATVFPIVYTAAAKSKTMAPAIALAAVSTIGFTGFLIGPPIIGFVAHATGLRLALTILVVLSLGIFLLARRAVIR